MKRSTQFSVAMTSALSITLVGVNVMATEIDNTMFITEGGFKPTTSIERNAKEVKQDKVKEKEYSEKEDGVSFASDFFSEATQFSTSEELIANIYTEKKAEEERIKRIQEMYERTSWLKDYGINPKDLSEERLNVLAEGYKHIGTPYVWGGTSPKGFDCSGFTRYVLKNTLGVDISRTTSSQPRSKYLKRVSLSEAKPSDLVYRTGQHTGFFIKDNGGNLTILHSPRPGKRLQIGPYTRNVKVYRPVAFTD